MTKACEILALPRYGAHQAKQYHYAQAVRISNRIETSGQGGWTPATYEYAPERSLRDQYLQALTCAGVTGVGRRPLHVRRDSLDGHWGVT